MPWKESHVMDERLRFVARLLESEKMAPLCAELGLAPEEEVALLLEGAVDLFAEHLIEIGHHPAAEPEALGWILPRPAGRLHDAIHGNLGANDNLSHPSLSSARNIVSSRVSERSSWRDAEPMQPCRHFAW